MRRQMAEALREDGYSLCTLGGGAEVIAEMASRMLRRGRSFDAVVLHDRLGGWSGLQILEGLRQSTWTTPVVFVVDLGDVSSMGPLVDRSLAQVVVRG